VRKDLPLKAGDRIGPYLLQRELGRGGAAVVWLAEAAPDAAPHASRPAGPVALKLANTEDREQTQRFGREFELLRTVRVPGVVRVHEAGLHEGTPWYTMDVVEGRRFTHVVREPAEISLRCRLACRLGARLATAVAALHSEGFVHRDLKPTNVLVDANGAPTVLDFGVVQLPFGAERWTRPGTVLGTLPFMAPEQVAGLPTGPTVDVFALGLMLYEGILGSRRTPDRPGAWVSLQCLQRIPPAALSEPRVPPALSALLERCCAFYPEDRPSMAEVAAALGDPSVLSAPAAPPTCPVFVGRERELATLLERALGESPSLTFIEGPSGSGRRRLVEQVHRRATVRGARVFRVVAGRDRPGAAAEDLLRQLLSRPDDPAEQARVLGPDAAALRAAWPGLPGPPSAGLAAGVPEVAELCQAVARTLSRAAQAHPLVLSVEDLELADALSLQLLAALPRHCQGPVHTLAIVDEQRVAVDARTWLRRLREAPGVHRLPLGDLPAGPFAELFTALAPGTAPPAEGGSPQRATELAHRHTDPANNPALSADALPLGLLTAPVPTAVIDALGSRAAWERAGLLWQRSEDRWSLRHAGLAAQARALLPDLQAAEDALADAIAKGWPGVFGRAPEARHRARGHRPAAARGPAILAAAAALEAGQLAEARQLLHLVDHLARDPKDPVYRSRRFTLAWARAELSLLGDGPLRADLVEQAMRRAQSPEDQALVALLQCRLEQRAGRAQALRRWTALCRAAETPPEVALRAGAALAHLLVDLGREDELDATVHGLGEAARRCRAPWAAPLAADARARVAEARGLFRLAEEEVHGALQTPALPAPLRLRLLLSRARARAGRGLIDAAEDDLRQLQAALREPDLALALADVHGGGWLAVEAGRAALALDQGEANTARRLLISAHARLGARTPPEPIARWTTLSLRLATRGGERAPAAELAARPLPPCGAERAREAWCARAELQLCLGGPDPGPPPAPRPGPATPAMARAALLRGESALLRRAWAEAAKCAEEAQQAAEVSECAPLSAAATLLRQASVGEAAAAWRYAAHAADGAQHVDLQMLALAFGGWRALRLGKTPDARAAVEALSTWAWRHADHRAAGRAAALAEAAG
jgi:hypothetical protein